MRSFVRIDIVETITPHKSEAATKIAGELMQRILGSGKLVEGEMFGDTCGGFFILDIDAPAELKELIGEAAFQYRV
ncbi:MAG: hypothetical protein ACE5KH_04090 [Candidatus Geothermarchaeales archaeon]